MIYKPIPCFSNYAVSDSGEIINHTTSRKLKPYDANGYRAIKIRSDEGRRRVVLLHRAVWEAYQGRIPAGYWINHKNGVRCDNTLANLECDTPKYNHTHARDVLKRKWASGLESGVRRLEPEQVAALRALHSKARWSQMRLAKLFGISQPAVNKILKLRNWRTVETSRVLCEQGKEPA
jgi:hypothetical protein